MSISIRVKLTIIYFCIVMFITSVFIVTMNTLVVQQYRKPPHEIVEIVRQEHPEFFEEYSNTNGFIDPADLPRIIDEIRNEDLERIRNRAVMTLVIVAALSLAIGYFVSGRILSPLRKLNEATKQLNADTLSIHLQGVNAQDELGELVRNFNAMTKRLQESFTLQKQFIENASHELKTPLTIVQTNLEALKGEKGSLDTHSQQYIERVLHSTDFMSRLIDELLLLSLTQEQVKKKNIDGNQVVQAVAHQLRPIAEQASKQLLIETLPAPVMIHANEILLQRALMNCIENAIKYSRKKILLHVDIQEEYVQYSISDDGEGIPPEHIDKVMERFYRIDSSRSRVSGGTGLGLAIVQYIMNMHGGTVSIKSVVGKGTTVTLSMSRVKKS